METTVKEFIAQERLRVKELQAILKEGKYNNVIELGLYMSEIKDTEECIDKLEKMGY